MTPFCHCERSEAISSFLTLFCHCDPELVSGEAISLFLTLFCHCERSEAISLFFCQKRDCRVAALLAMTMGVSPGNDTLLSLRATNRSAAISLFLTLFCHCERSEAISLFFCQKRDCFVAALLAMTEKMQSHNSSYKSFH